jgi:hypothetical protein
MDYTDEYWERRYTVCWFLFTRLVLQVLLSSGTGRLCPLLQNNNMRECHPREARADVYLEALVFRLSWKDGNTKSSSRGNTSTSSENVESKPT